MTMDLGYILDGFLYGIGFSIAATFVIFTITSISEGFRKMLKR